MFIGEAIEDLDTEPRLSAMALAFFVVLDCVATIGHPLQACVRGSKYLLETSDQDVSRQGNSPKVCRAVGRGNAG